jgi:uncharacterized protein YlxW (UPF0749 family)
MTARDREKRRRDSSSRRHPLMRHSSGVEATMPILDQVEWHERVAKLFLAYTSTSTFPSDVARTTRDRLLITSLVSLGVLSGTFILTKIAPGLAEFTIASTLGIRVGFGLTCSYLIALLIAQSMQDYQILTYQSVISTASLVRELDATGSELREILESINQEAAQIQRRISEYSRKVTELLAAIEARRKDLAYGDENGKAELKALEAQLDDTRESELREQRRIEELEPQRKLQDDRTKELASRTESVQKNINKIERVARVRGIMEVSVPVAIGVVAVLQCLGLL